MTTTECRTMRKQACQTGTLPQRRVVSYHFMAGERKPSRGPVSPHFTRWFCSRSATKKGGGPKGRRRKSRNAIESVLDGRGDKDFPSQAVVDSRESVAVAEPE